MQKESELNNTNVRDILGISVHCMYLSNLRKIFFPINTYLCPCHAISLSLNGLYRTKALSKSPGYETLYSNYSHGRYFKCYSKY